MVAIGCEIDWYMWLKPAAWMDDSRLLWPPPGPAPPPPPLGFVVATAGGLTEADEDDSVAGVPFCWSSPPPPPPLRWFLNFSSRRHFARRLLNQTCEEKNFIFTISSRLIIV